MRFLLEQDLARALPDGQLFLEYQPIVDAETLKIARYEALLRWQHPVRGLVGPGEFIGVGEACGLIVPMGLWALETACMEAATWPDGIGVSINLSPLQFIRGSLAEQVEQVLLRTGLAPARLNLEVTEGVLLEGTAVVVQAMTRLRCLGIRFSLDDFGTGHAGLTYLRRFPFDVLKIDKSFVQDAGRQDVAGQPGSRALLAAITAIGAAFSLEVVAEGVETETELALARELGCGQVQGFLTGRPSQAIASMHCHGHPSHRPKLALVQPL